MDVHSIVQNTCTFDLSRGPGMWRCSRMACTAVLYLPKMFTSRFYVDAMAVMMRLVESGVDKA